jgi:hypothetical protein
MPLVKVGLGVDGLVWLHAQREMIRVNDVNRVILDIDLYHQISLTDY